MLVGGHVTVEGYGTHNLFMLHAPFSPVYMYSIFSLLCSALHSSFLY